MKCMNSYLLVSFSHVHTLIWCIIHLIFFFFCSHHKSEVEILTSDLTTCSLQCRLSPHMVKVQPQICPILKTLINQLTLGLPVPPDLFLTRYMWEIAGLLFLSVNQSCFSHKHIFTLIYDHIFLSMSLSLNLGITFICKALEWVGMATINRLINQPLKSLFKRAIIRNPGPLQICSCGDVSATQILCTLFDVSWQFQSEISGEWH